jgi:hypothetical protein
MVGALALSRVVADPARSDAFLKTVRDHLKQGWSPTVDARRPIAV